MLECDQETAEKAAEMVLEVKLDPFKAVTQVLTPAIQEMGERFEKGEAFLPELIMATDAMNAAVKILEKEIPKRGWRGRRRAGSSSGR